MQRKRRTKAEMVALMESIYALCAEHQPLTVRSLFYRAVSTGVVEKLEAEYNSIVVITGKMRKAGELPFEWLVDAGRFARKPLLYVSPSERLEGARDTYQRDYWQDQPGHAEVWVEKDAVVGVVEPVTRRLQVPLYSCKGYPSLSMIWGAAQSWPEKPVSVRYFGDSDPSGEDIPRSVQDNIAAICGREVDFRVCAITPDQIAAYDLPTRPTKKSDTRAKNYRGESVELDAFEPAVLRALVEQSVEAEIDAALWGEAEKKHESDKEVLSRAVDRALAEEGLA